MGTATKHKPPIALKRKAAPPPPPPVVESTGPRRLTICPKRKGRRVVPEGVVHVIWDLRGRWGSPFRIMDAPACTKPYWVVWSGQGAGRWRSLPEGWEPIKFVDRKDAQREAAFAFLRWLNHPDQANLLALARAQLGGKDLACWCSQSSPCHADVLTKLANPKTEGAS